MSQGQKFYGEYPRRTGTSGMQLTMSKRLVDQKGHASGLERYCCDIPLGFLCRSRPKRPGMGRLFLDGLPSRPLDSSDVLHGAKLTRLRVHARFVLFRTR